MEWIFYVFVALGVLGIGVAIYERKKKRTLLKHDLNKDVLGDPHTHAATVQAYDATLHRISGFDR